ncbi:MAG: SiaB family protein kinase [Tenuifilum sp.]|uniref:SiaB family protein kinase n=1 Tax=Tenuifilum sp. TaxID=2760880 RepID=UPI001B42D6FC|nr:SiaB family protein kinase [Bacteroidales bacterium]HOK61423.1 SiaB family protein kinase [Tenuifilum sp.]MBP9028678.1 SiaB family protein kinase [Bacteroidales bacterium]HOK86123.1 SiaB family protein kinase [Tenuifilum sp.]HON70029.1 SiaB family protein kinase [Tenuifilum sp.]
MEKGEVLINHYGPLSYEEIGFLLNKMTSLLERYNFGITIRKKVYSAMVESLENIYKHQDVIKGSNNYQPKFSLVLEKDKVDLSCSNSLLKVKIGPLKERLEKVNQLDKAGLKEFYKEVILSGNVTQKGGAGLGIINIAKVTENKLEFTFDDIDEQYTYFTLRIKVSLQNQNN